MFKSRPTRENPNNLLSHIQTQLLQRYGLTNYIIYLKSR